MKIETLTKEQENRIPQYIDKWIDYASSSLDFFKARKAIVDIYKLMDKKEPTILVANGPIDAFWSAVAVQLICGDKKTIENFDSTLGSPLDSTLESTLGSTLRSTLRSTLGSTLGSTLDSALRSTLRSTLESTLDSTLYSTLESTLRSTLRSTLESTLDSTLGSTLESTLGSPLDSTLESTLGSTLESTLRSTLDSALGSTLYSTLYSTLDSALRSTLRSTLDSTLYSTLESTLGSTLRSTLRNTLGSTLGSTLDSALRSTLKNVQVDKKIKKSMDNAYQSLLVTQWWSWWAGFYDYGQMIGVKFDEDKLNIFRDFCSEIPLIYTFDRLVIICKKPKIAWKQIINSKARILHCEDGPAISYEDGFKIFLLNNVRMTEEQVMTPAEKIDIKAVIKEENTEVRRELIRKIGIERFIQKAGAKVLDKQGDYEVLTIHLSEEVPDARYLKMLNPSIGVWHVEGIEKECDTVEKALNWRAGNINEKWEPAILT